MDLPRASSGLTGGPGAAPTWLSCSHRAVCCALSSFSPCGARKVLMQQACLCPLSHFPLLSTQLLDAKFFLLQRPRILAGVFRAASGRLYFL